MRERKRSGWPKGLGEEGIALALTVWVLAVLALVGAEFMFSSRLRLKADRHVMAGTEAYGLALAGYEAALDALGPDLRAVSRDDEKGFLLHRRGEEEPIEGKTEDEALGDGTYSYAIEDEDGKVDINRQPRNILVALLAAAGMEAGVDRDTVADSIMDWRDPNREHHLNGAEEDYYRGLEKPYSCKDGPIEAPAELLLVKGVTEDLYYGAEGDGGAEGDDGAALGPLEDWVTVYPVVFNIATAPKEVLEILKKARPPRAGRISQYYRITVTGQSGAGAERSIRAVVRREARGRNITFSLLYWDDNFDIRQRSEDAVE